MKKKFRKQNFEKNIVNVYVYYILPDMNYIYKHFMIHICDNTCKIYSSIYVGYGIHALSNIS